MKQLQIDVSGNIQDSTSRVILQNIYPWIVWILGASFFFYKYVLQVSPSVMSTDLMRSFSITGAGLGNLAACFFYAYLIMQIPVGILLDRYSPRYIMLFAILTCAVGTFLFAHADSVFMAGMSRAMIGFGTAFAAVSCFKLATIWFPPKRFALVAGLSMTAAMLGAVGGQAPLSFLTNALGWRDAMTFIAWPGFLLAILTLILIRDKKSDATSTITQSSPNMNSRQLWNQMKLIFKHRQTWLLSLYSGLAFAPVSVFGGLWGVSFLEQAYHLKPTSAASVTSTIFLGFAIGCPLAGWFSDYIKRRKIIMTIGTIIALVSMSCALYLPSASQLSLQLIMLSFGLGASCFFLCFSMIREIHPLIFAATVLGFMNTFDSICEALAEPFVGKLLDLGWTGTLEHGARIFSAHNYHMSLSVLSIFLLMALFILFFIKETGCQQKI